MHVRLSGLTFLLLREECEREGLVVLGFGLRMFFFFLWDGIVEVQGEERYDLIAEFDAP